MHLKPSLSNHASKLFAVAGIFAFTSSVFAGGLQKGTQAVNSFGLWFYGFIGLMAVIYLGYKGLELWQDKETFADFGKAIAKVALVGAVMVLAGWAWSLFS